MNQHSLRHKNETHDVRHHLGTTGIKTIFEMICRILKKKTLDRVFHLYSLSGEVRVSASINRKAPSQPHQTRELAPLGCWPIVWPKNKCKCSTDAKASTVQIRRQMQYKYKGKYSTNTNMDTYTNMHLRVGRGLIDWLSTSVNPDHKFLRNDENLYVYNVYNVYVCTLMIHIETQVNINVKKTQKYAAT